jgi:hypothetical protein
MPISKDKGEFEVYDALYAWCRLEIAENDA